MQNSESTQSRASTRWTLFARPRAPDKESWGLFALSKSRTSGPASPKVPKDGAAQATHQDLRAPETALRVDWAQGHQPSPASRFSFFTWKYGWNCHVGTQEAGRNLLWACERVHTHLQRGLNYTADLVGVCQDATIIHKHLTQFLMQCEHALCCLLFLMLLFSGARETGRRTLCPTATCLLP